MILQGWFQRQAARREHPRVINRLSEESAQRSRNSHEWDIQPRIRLRQPAFVPQSRDYGISRGYGVTRWTRRFSDELLIACGLTRQPLTSLLRAGLCLSQYGFWLRYRPSAPCIA